MNSPGIGLRLTRRAPGADASAALPPSTIAAGPAAARALAIAVALAAALALPGCAGTAAPPNGLMELLDRPAERALYEGLRAYDDGQYASAESALRRALAQALPSPRDRATAHKLLAFIHCTSDRLDSCESEFRAARAADPSFSLARAEAGHPVWGPVYRRVVP